MNFEDVVRRGDDIVRRTKFKKQKQTFDVTRWKHEVPVASNAAEPQRETTSVASPGLQVAEEQNVEPMIRTPPPNLSNQPLESEKDHKEVTRRMKIHYSRAKLMERQQKYVEAAEELRQSLLYEVQLKGDDNLDVANTYDMLGRCFRRINRNKEGVVYLKKALEIYQRNGYTDERFPDKLWRLHDFIAEATDGPEEIEHYNTAIKILTATYDSPPERLAHMLNNLGNAYHRAGSLNEARDRLEKAKDMMEGLYYGQNNEELAKVLSSIADVYIDLGEDDKAIRELDQAIKIREGLGTIEGKLSSGTSHKKLAEIYARVGNKTREDFHRRKSKAALDQLRMASSKERNDNLEYSESSDVDKINHLAARLIAPEEISKAQRLQQAGQQLEAIEYYEKAIKSLEESDPQLNQSKEVQRLLSLCLNNVGNCYRRTNEFDKAESCFKRALEIRQGLYGDTTDDVASTMFNLGHMYSRLGGKSYTLKAVDIHEKCLNIYLKLGGVDNLEYRGWIISLYRSLGAGYDALGEGMKAVWHYEEAKKIIDSNASKDPEELIAIYNNVGNAYESIEDFEKAEYNLQKGLEVARKLESDKPEDTTVKNHIAACLNNLGVTYQSKGDLEKSRECLVESMNIRKEWSTHDVKALDDLPSSLHNLGNTLVKLERFDEALNFYLEEKDVRDRLGQSLEDIDLTISEVYAKLGMDDKVAEILDKY